jgi:hypothetical protein
MYYTCRETQPSFCAKDSERPVNWNLSYLARVDKWTIKTGHPAFVIRKKN